ncbi:MAG: NTP transferase domain-containing protein [Deltaproteobacteria bacterium]|nr:NTP transferase domain-containing protein [Deltaproteobacteria bacterium]
MMFSTVILAAGKGTRMKSGLVKVLHPLYGKPLLSYVVEAARSAGSHDISIIIGYQADSVREKFQGGGLNFIEQREQLGTGHAVLQARERFANYKGAILILCGDVPLLQSATLRSLWACHRQEKTAVTVLTTVLTISTGYGRIVKGADRKVSRIVEERDATEEEKQIQEINTGIYCVNSQFLFDALRKIKNNNAQHEYYLTDIIAIAHNSGEGVASLIAADHREVMGINTPEELREAHRYLDKLHEKNERPPGLL